MQDPSFHMQASPHPTCGVENNPPIPWMRKLRPEGLNSLFKVTKRGRGAAGVGTQVQVQAQGCPPPRVLSRWLWPGVALLPGDSLQRARSALAHVDSPCVLPGARLSHAQLGAVRQAGFHPVGEESPPGALPWEQGLTRVYEQELAKAARAWNRALRIGF